MSDREVFFYEHAGYSYNPATETQEEGRRRCGRELARAEAEAAKRGYVTEWVEDDSPDLSWADVPEHEETREKLESGEWAVLGCIVTDPETDESESLWGIVVAPGDAYMEVVAAELADELLSRTDAESSERDHWAARDTVTV